MRRTDSRLSASGRIKEWSRSTGHRAFLRAADRSLFWTGITGQRAVRRGRWKYLRDGSTGLLFDLQADIGERNNVFRDRPELARELHAELNAWVELLPEPERQ